jgi:HEAT repeat protein
MVALMLWCASARAGDLYGSLDLLAAEARAPDPVRRRDAVDKLDAYGTDEARPILARAMSDADTDVRARAAASIGRHHAIDLLPQVVKAVGDPEPRLRQAACEAIGQLLAGPAANEPSAEAKKAVEVLERALGDGEHDVRQAAVVALGKLPPSLADKAAVALTGRLDDESSGVREKTAEVLGRIGGGRAVIPLLARLADTTREVRAAALSSLALLGDARAVPAIIRMLRDPADEVRGEAVAALGRLKATAAVPALVDEMERGPEALRGRAAFALGQIASQPAAGTEAAVTALSNALDRDDLRAAAREALLRLGAAAVPSLLSRLGEARGNHAALDVELLGAIGDRRATLALLDELGRGRVPDEAVVDALGAMARAGDRRPLPELVARLTDKSPSLRRHAAEALRGTVDARADSVLALATADSDGSVRAFALGELGRLGARGQLPAILRALGSADADTAEAAAAALGQMGQPDARAAEALVVALDRPERRVRRQAADSLARVAGGSSAIVPAVVSAIGRAVKTAAPERREAAVVALGNVLRRKSDGVAREILFAQLDGSDAAAALAAVDALGAMGDDAAAPRLMRILDGNGDPALRRRAAAALGELDGDDVVRGLVAALRGDADVRVRAEAAWSLGKRARLAAKNSRGSDDKNSRGSDDKSSRAGDDKNSRAAADVAAALEAALHAAAPAVRANAAAALFRLGRAPAALVPLLDDADPAARGNAALALAHTPSAARAIARMADGDDDRHARAAAKRALANAAGNAAPSPRNDWIAFDVLDFDGAPVADARYRLVLPDGVTRSGTTDERAVVRDDTVPGGSCSLVIDEAPAPR